MPEDRVVINIDRYGNMMAATILLADLQTVLDDKRLKKGDLVLLVRCGRWVYGWSYDCCGGSFKGRGE